MFSKLSKNDLVIVRLIEGNKSIIKKGKIQEINDDFVIVSIDYGSFDIKCQIYKNAVDKVIVGIDGKKIKMKSSISYNIELSKIRHNFYSGTLYENKRWVRNYQSETVKANNKKEAYNKLKRKFEKKYSDIKIRSKIQYCKRRKNK